METSHTRDALPTVSRLCDGEIIELVYDRSNRTTALAIAAGDGWKVVERHVTAAGETLIPYAPTNNLITHSCVLLPSKPAPSRGKVRLLADIEAYLHRYVDFSPLFEKIAAHYVLLSWVHDAFQEIPMLRVRGAFGAGKTRALIALGSIA